MFNSVSRVVDVDGLTVNAKEISDIAERGKPPTAKVSVFCQNVY